MIVRALAPGIGAGSAGAATVTPVEGTWHPTTCDELPVTFRCDEPRPIASGRALLRRYQHCADPGFARHGSALLK